MNTHKIILLTLTCSVLLVSMIGAILDFRGHKRKRRLFGAIGTLLLIYGLLFYLAYNG